MNTEAFLAKKNVYFNYEFDEIEVDADFPETIHRSLVGLLYKHVIQYPNMTYCIYHETELAGEELEKMQQDWARYCPLENA